MSIVYSILYGVGNKELSFGSFLMGTPFPKNINIIYGLSYLLTSVDSNVTKYFDNRIIAKSVRYIIFKYGQERASVSLHFFLPVRMGMVI